MKILTFKTAEEIGEAAGKLFVETVQKKDKAVLGLATGATPVPTYTYMAKACDAGEVSFKNVTTFNLDEYCDLPKEHKNSYYSFMFENLFSKIDIDPANVNFLNGNAADAQVESDRYAAAITPRSRQRWLRRLFARVCLFKRTTVGAGTGTLRACW